MSRAGLSLVELLVALTISSIAIVAGHAALGGLLELRQRASDRMDTARASAAVRRTLAGWIRCARVQDEGEFPFLGLDRETGGTADDAISFLASAALPFVSGHTRISLYIDRDEATPERGLVAELREASGVEVRRLEVATEASSLDVLYLYDGPDRRRWLPSWVSSVRLPDAVELRIGPADSLPPLLRLPITVATALGS